MKFTCFIDTCSFINLTNFEFNKGTLLNLLYEKVNIKFSSEVNFEISHHYDIRMPDNLKRSSNIYRPTKYSHTEYEKRIFDNNVLRASGNKGERDNFSSMLDYYLHEVRGGGIIFLTDDVKATEGNFIEPLSAFPISRVWNTFDTVIFLLLAHKFVTTDIAKRAISDLDAFMATDDEKMDQEKTRRRVQKRKFYLKCVDRIHNVLFVKS